MQADHYNGRKMVVVVVQIIFQHTSQIKVLPSVL